MCFLPICSYRILRSHGLQTLQLHEVAKATTVASLMYASPSWCGFTSARDRDRMELLINKLKRSGFLPMSAPSASTLANKADLRLFRAVTQELNHVLRKLLPSGGNLAPSLGGPKNFSPTKMTFFWKNFHFSGKNF